MSFCSIPGKPVTGLENRSAGLRLRDANGDRVAKYVVSGAMLEDGFGHVALELDSRFQFLLAHL